MRHAVPGLVMCRSNTFNDVIAIDCIRDATHNVVDNGFGLAAGALDHPAHGVRKGKQLHMCE